MNIKHCTTWDVKTKRDVLRALELYKSQCVARNHPLGASADPMYCMGCILGGTLDACIISGKYLLLYGYGPTIFNPDMVFEEYMVLSVYPEAEASIQVIPKAIEHLAKSLGCSAVTAGNSTGRQGISRMYTQAGWQLLAQQFYKAL